MKLSTVHLDQSYLNSGYTTYQKRKNIKSYFIFCFRTSDLDKDRTGYLCFKTTNNCILQNYPNKHIHGVFFEMLEI